MADEVDITNERAEMTLMGEIAASKKPHGPVPTGRCHYCDEIVGDSMRWCNATCLLEWEREVARRRQP
jgi:hypothetical protein